MANIFTTVAHDVEVGAEDALKVITMGEVDLTKLSKASPKVIAALGVILGAISTALTNAEASAQAGLLNIALDSTTLASVKAVWPDVTTFLLDLGIKL